MRKLRDESEKVLKKQRLSSSNVVGHIDSLLRSIESGRTELASAGGEQQGRILSETSSSTQATASKIAKEYKIFHAAVSKFGKSIDKNVPSDTSKHASKAQTLSLHAVNSLAAEHFCRLGRFEIAATLGEEASPAGSSKDPLIPPALADCFAEMHEVRKALGQKDLKRALEWVDKHREHDNLVGSPLFMSLHFQLVKLRFLQLLDASQQEALDFSRREFPRFAESEMRGIQRLMGCLMYFGRLRSSPYQDLFAEEHWSHASSTLIKCCCEMSGVSDSSPLAELVDTGIAALPTLVKMFEVMKSSSTGRDDEEDGESGDESPTLWDAEQLPVEVPLSSRKRQHHSVFSCPVSREQATSSNPPVLLKCGHVICRNTVRKITESNPRFKCPTCPVEQEVKDTREIRF